MNALLHLNETASGSGTRRRFYCLILNPHNSILTCLEMGTTRVATHKGERVAFGSLLMVKDQYISSILIIQTTEQRDMFYDHYVPFNRKNIDWGNSRWLEFLATFTINHFKRSLSQRK